MAHWGVEESGGGKVGDLVGGLRGTLSASGAEIVEGGVSGHAVYLERAEGGFVDMGDVLALEDSFTIVVWVKTAPNDTTESNVVLGRYEVGTANGYYLALNRSGFIGMPGKAMFVASDAAGHEVISETDVNDGQWHQIAATYEAGVAKGIYVDGMPGESSGPATGIVANGASFLIGGVTLAGQAAGFFQGWVDEVQVYGRVLADVEVQYLFVHPDAEVIPSALEPQIISAPLDQSAVRGSAVEFTVEVTGEEPVEITWAKDGVPIEGAVASVLRISNLQPEDEGVYSVTASNLWGAATASATLTVLWPPAVTVSPRGQSAALGSSVNFSVAAEGASPLSYQWYKDGHPISDARSRFLLISNVQPASEGAYRVKVWNLDGEALSDVAALEVYSGVLAVEATVDGMVVAVSGLQAGANYVLEVAAELRGTATPWEPLATVVDSTGSFVFVDGDPRPAQGARFYRVRFAP